MTDDETHTTPWHADEFVIIDGRKFVYTINPLGAIVVRLPGGGEMTIAELRAAGHEVTRPMRVRRT